MIQRKVRKKRSVLMLMQEESETYSPMYSKQTNKMWFLKSLVMSKRESRTSLHEVKYK